MKKAKNFSFLLFFSILNFQFLISNSYAQTLVEVKATVDKKEATVGDSIKYEILMKIQKGVTVETPELNQIGNFEILAKKEEKSKDGDSTKLTYTIAAFKTGEDTISGVNFKCRDNKNNEWTVTPDPIVITIKSVLPAGTQDIRDIKPPVSIPRNLLVLFGSILLFLIIVGVAFWWFFYRKKGIFKLTKEALKPPHIIAYERLDALKFTEGKFKEYYTELSDIIRRYIEARYEISAPTETTFELYRELRAAKVEYDKIELIKDFLSECDMVKFAKYIPLVEFVEKDKTRAKGIVDKTKVGDLELKVDSSQNGIENKKNISRI